MVLFFLGCSWLVHTAFALYVSFYNSPLVNLYFIYYIIYYILYVWLLDTHNEYLSKVLEYSSTKLKLSCIKKNLGGTQGACTLYQHRSVQPEPICLNIGVLTLNLLYCYLDAIFVLPCLGTCQGMSTKMGDQKYMKICIN